MDITTNILAPNATGMANALQSKGVGLQGGLLAFLDILVAPEAEIAPGSELSAKIAELLQNSAPGQTAIPALLSSAGTSQLQAAEQPAPSAQPEPLPLPGPGEAPAALTSDLTAKFSADVQEDPALLAELTEKFSALIEDGSVTPDELAHFRKEAIGFLKEKGLDQFTIGKYLVALANQLGEKLTTPVAAQLGMPVPAKALAADAEGETMTGREFAARRPLTPPARPAAVPAAPASASSDPAPVKSAPAQAAAPRPELPAPADARAEAPAAKPQAPAPAPLALVNSLAQADAGANDGVQPLFQNNSGQTAAMTPANAASPGFVNHMQATSEAAPTAQLVAVQIQRNANAKMDSFTMQLEPLELGRLEIRMKFGRDGTIKAHLIAEKPETLSLLQKDALQIQRILQAAGLETDEGSLSFDLRQQAQHEFSDSSYGADRRAGIGPVSRGADALQALIAIESPGAIRQGGVNIIV